MESINIHLFQLLNAGAGLAGPGLALPVFLAEYLLWVVPALLVLLWFRDRSEPALRYGMVSLEGDRAIIRFLCFISLLL